MSPQEQYETVVAAMKSAGERCGSLAASRVGASDEPTTVSQLEAFWLAVSEIVRDELSETLGKWGLEPSTIAHFQQIALDACEGEFIRLLAAWSSEGGRA